MCVCVRERERERGGAGEGIVSPSPPSDDAKRNNYPLLLTPSSTVLDKLSGFQLDKFPAFHGTRRFITALTSARHLSLS